MKQVVGFESVFKINFEINFLQCYGNGKLKYTELCNFLQITAGLHADSGGIGLEDLNKHNQAWVLAKMVLEVTKSPKWKDTITVETWIKVLKNSRSVRCFEIFCEGKKIAGCETFWVIINTKTRRPDFLTIDSSHVVLYEDRQSVLKSFTKINPITRANFEIDRKVVLSDLDIVNHVNNIKYLEWCLDYLKVNLVIEERIKRFEMQFLREIIGNELVTISLEDNKFEIFKADTKCFILEIDTHL